jgi:predicted dehydrogenase
MPELFGARIAGSPGAVLASGVDGMIIAAPTGFHTELIELCVAAGLPTFLAAGLGPGLPLRSAEPGVSARA